MLDRGGDENFRPTLVPTGGGPPVPVFGAQYPSHRFSCSLCLPERSLAIFSVEDVRDPVFETIRVYALKDGEWGCYTIKPNASETIATAESWLEKREWEDWG